ncbi:MAG: DNA repair protein RecO [Gammaproteobacteria bacterium]|nr:DNA repair protein RecO [Gammaproteobacteria bacterium]
MRYLAEPGYVLHTRLWRETSLLVEVLSEQHGRVGLVARGVRGPKRHPLRAALQPLQHIRFDAVQRGELAWLNAAEALDIAPHLAGEAMLAAFYLNELVLGLAARNDPQQQLYAIYGEARARLAADKTLAWTLRRFERDLLDALGSGFALDRDGDGDAIDPAARYRLDPEHGPRRLHSDRGQAERSGTATGRALLALAADRLPDPDDLAGLRRPLRAVLVHHLGGRGLHSWDLLGDLAKLAPRTAPSD